MSFFIHQHRVWWWMCLQVLLCLSMFVYVSCAHFLVCVCYCISFSEQISVDSRSLYMRPLEAFSYSLTKICILQKSCLQEIQEMETWKTYALVFQSNEITEYGDKALPQVLYSLWFITNLPRNCFCINVLCLLTNVCVVNNLSGCINQSQVTASRK